MAFQGMGGRVKKKKEKKDQCIIDEVFLGLNLTTFAIVGCKCRFPLLISCDGRGPCGANGMPRDNGARPVKENIFCPLVKTVNNSLFRKKKSEKKSGNKATPAKAGQSKGPHV